MTSTDPVLAEPTIPELRRADFERWRRRSRLIRTLRIALPALIAIVVAAPALPVAVKVTVVNPAPLARS